MAFSLAARAKSPSIYDSLPAGLRAVILDPVRCHRVQDLVFALPLFRRRHAHPSSRRMSVSWRWQSASRASAKRRASCA